MCRGEVSRILAVGDRLPYSRAAASTALMDLQRQSGMKRAGQRSPGQRARSGSCINSYSRHTEAKQRRSTLRNHQLGSPMLAPLSTIQINVWSPV